MEWIILSNYVASNNDQTREISGLVPTLAVYRCARRLVSFLPGYVYSTKRTAIFHSVCLDVEHTGGGPMEKTMARAAAKCRVSSVWKRQPACLTFDDANQTTARKMCIVSFLQDPSLSYTNEAGICSEDTKP